MFYFLQNYDKNINWDKHIKSYKLKKMYLCNVI